MFSLRRADEILSTGVVPSRPRAPAVGQSLSMLLGSRRLPEQMVAETRYPPDGTLVFFLRRISSRRGNPAAWPPSAPSASAFQRNLLQEHHPRSPFRPRQGLPTRS